MSFEVRGAFMFDEQYFYFRGKVPGVKAVKPSSENPRWGSAR